MTKQLTAKHYNVGTVEILQGAVLGTPKHRHVLLGVEVPYVPWMESFYQRHRNDGPLIIVVPNVCVHDAQQDRQLKDMGNGKRFTKMPEQLLLNVHI